MEKYMQQYCNLLCQPVSQLADEMFVELGTFGTQCVVSLSKEASQQVLKPADKAKVDWDGR